MVFYRGGWCPYCNQQLHDLALRYPEFQKLGVELAAVSVDQPDKSAESRERDAIPFQLFSDSKLALRALQARSADAADSQ